MAIRSHPFGGTVLTGEDARRFREHVAEVDADVNLRRAAETFDACEAAGTVKTVRVRLKSSDDSHSS